MTYIFKGRLCGYICPECPEPISRSTVKLYRSRKNQDTTSLAVANPKDTFAILSDADIKAKASSLIAETETNDDGSFTFELGENTKYAGEAFEIDVYCGTVPHRKPGPNPPGPVQFSITTLQPMWRQTEAGLIAAWEYCIPSRFWCAVRSRFGAWTICGQVTECRTKFPVAGLKVRAFDTDWLQNDDLGFGFTDSSGKFRIDYLRSDFEKTIFSPALNIELFGGPDLYFRVETPGGIVLLNEPPSQGRTPGRQNAGPCFCVDLCIDKAPPGDNPIPLFTHVGQYRVDPVFNDFTADGLTTAGNLAFTMDIPLRGVLPNGSDPAALEYHFMQGEYDTAGMALGPVTDVDVTMISPTVIGVLEYFDWTGVAYVLRADNYWVNNPGIAPTVIHRQFGPPIVVTLNQPVKAGGWIKVPRQNNLAPEGNGLFVGGFVDMVQLNTTKLTNEFFDLTLPLPELQAGQSVPAGKKSRMHRFKLFFEARKVGTIPILSSNVREKIVLSNTSYKQHHHPDWAGFIGTSIPVVMIDVAELTAPGSGCKEVGNHAHALYTAYHPFLGSVTVFLEGPNPPPLPAAINPAIVGGQAVSPVGGDDFDITVNPTCAYILWISLTLNLTRGYGTFLGTFEDHIAFCKG